MENWCSVHSQHRKYCTFTSMIKWIHFSSQLKKNYKHQFIHKNFPFQQINIYLIFFCSALINPTFAIGSGVRRSSLIGLSASRELEAPARDEFSSFPLAPEILKEIPQIIGWASWMSRRKLWRRRSRFPKYGISIIWDLTQTLGYKKQSAPGIGK